MATSLHTSLKRAAASIRGGAAAVRQPVRHRSTAPVPIAVAYGDGIGPEIMTSTLAILEAAKANIAPQVIAVGEAVYKAGHTSGIEPESWDVLRRTKVFLKAPITTPSGGGYKSLNVSIRKTLGLYANVRPCQSYAPFVSTRHPKLDLVVVRENEEDLYAGIEHRQTQDVYQCLKLITRPGCERITRYAFEYARAHNRKKVTCIVKDNIMKLTDGLFYKVFEEIGKAEYPDIKRERMIVDIGAALLADQPERFDVILTSNLYGDILSDIAAQLTGGVGLGPSANIGEHVSMFEAIHGSAPDISGKDIANPSGLLLAAVQMLAHVNHPTTAQLVYNAWAKTVEDGVHTVDIFREGTSKKQVGTKDFTRAVIDRLGAAPTMLPPGRFTSATPSSARAAEVEAAHAANPVVKWTAPVQEKVLTGIDVFLEWAGDASGKKDAEELSRRLRAAAAAVPSLQLSLITNRGVKVWPGGYPETFTVDHWRCRFRATAGPMAAVPYSDCLKLMAAVSEAGLDCVKSENLCLFSGPDGKLAPGFSLGQGE